MNDDVATWTLGLTRQHIARVLGNGFTNNEELELEFTAAKQRAIHGNTSGLGGAGVTATGLKHSKWNKIRLGSQYSYLDIVPCVLIVPIMSLEAAKKWSGESCEAIVMAGEYGDFTIQTVCEDIGMMRFSDNIANDNEIDVARQLLVHFLCGIAYSLSQRTEEFFASYQSYISDHPLFNMQGGGITLPTMVGRSSQHYRHRVRKVALGNAHANQHHAPDPYLLAVKAGVVWSTRCHQRLLAGEEA